MKYIVHSLVFLTFVACGNQHDEERHAKSVQNFKERSSERKPYVNPASYKSLAYLNPENNQTQESKEELLTEVSSVAKTSSDKSEENLSKVMLTH